MCRHRELPTDQVDAETSVPLSNVTNSYYVTPKAFVEAEYPVDPAQPETQIANVSAVSAAERFSHTPLASYEL